MKNEKKGAASGKAAPAYNKNNSVKRVSEKKFCEKGKICSG